MDALEEEMGNNSNSSNNNEHSHVVVKGKRTKRQRLLLLHSPAPTVTTASSTSSAEFSGSTTEEEEDMANCLILLAQGRAKLESRMEEEGGNGGGEKFTSRKFAEAATTTNGKAGFYVYECKTCNKCFPSFQALGGHRASHKRPKTATVSTLEDKKPLDEDGLQISIAPSFPKPPITDPHNNNTSSSSNNKSRVHECSVCGSEFSSGQALGGHMRRHRPSAIIPESQEVKKEKNILSLDLNLPAPSEDDHRGDFPKSPSSSFAFANKQPLIFSASTLVDCHY